MQKSGIHTGVRYILSCITLIFVLSCSSDVSIAGSGSQSGNGRITCKVYNSDGTPASDAKVIIRPSDYIADTSKLSQIDSLVVTFDTKTDSNGAFKIGAIDNGSYCIEVNDGKSHAAVMNCTLTEKDTMLPLPDVTLLPTGAVKGVLLTEPDTSVKVYIGIKGLERSSKRDTVQGGFVLNDVPAGTFTVSILSSSPAYKPLTDTNVVVKPGTVTTLDSIDYVHQSLWSYKKRIFLNTSSTGADISGTVTDFPLFVRLNAQNFDFTQVKADGSDLLFTKRNGTLLRYEIENWDIQNRDASVWVLLDTIYGKDSTQYISLYSGNVNATYVANGARVFDTASGYTAAWHLGESGASITDATINQYNGTRNGSQARTPGMCGYAQSMDGVSSFTDMGNVVNPGTADFTVCAWVKRTAAGIQTIVSKSAGGSAGPEYGWLIQLDNDGAFGIYIATQSGTWGTKGTFVLTANKWITDTLWHHTAAVINRLNSNNCRVYLDGNDVSTLPTGGDIINIGAIANNLPLRIGSDAPGNYHWKGALDEISVLYRALSPDEIKLRYLNQKSANELLIIDK